MFGYHPVHRSVIQALLDYGLVVVIPSGNGGWDFVQDPPGPDKAAVAYLREGGRGAIYVTGSASFANKGPGFQVTGPASVQFPVAGANVISTGTSPAAAAVAGLVCRMQSAAKGKAGALDSALVGKVLSSVNLVGPPGTLPNASQLVPLVANNDAAALTALA